MDERPVRRAPRGFEDLMTRGERIAAGIYLPLHAAVLPLLLTWLAAAGGGSLVTLNALLYSAGTLYTVVFLRKYLRRSFDVLLDSPVQSLLALVSGIALDFALSWALSLAMLLLGGALGTTANNEAVVALASEGRNRMFAMTVFLAPVVEEPIFRGLLYGAVRRRSRAAACFVSVLMFGLYHVWQYVFAYGDWRFLLQIINYIPVSVALCYSYERSGTIWVPMAFHMFINAMSMSMLT